MSLDNKVTETLDSLESLVDQAENSKAAKSSVSMAITALDRVTKLASTDEVVQAIGNLYGPGTAAALDQVAEQATTLSATLSQVINPQQQDAPVNEIQALMDWFDPDTKTRASKLIERYLELVPKRRTTGEHVSPDLGFTVQSECGVCGELVASTGKNNVNSFRDMMRQHSGTKHGNKFSRGDAQHEEVTKAIKEVFAGSDQAAGGGYKISKSKS